MKKRIIAAALAALLCLGVLPAAASAAYEAEPNNEFKTATKISVNQKVNAAFADDEDYYRLTLSEAGALSIEATADTAVDEIWVYVYAVGSDGEPELVFLRAYDFPDNSVNDTYSFKTDDLCLPAGTYFFFLSGSDGSYSFTPVFTPAKNIELEPNSDFRTATPIHGNTAIKGSFMCDNTADFNRYWSFDNDWYRIVCAEPTSLTISLHVPTALRGNERLYSVGSDGELQEIYSFDYYGVDSIYDHTDYVSDAVGVASGTYYIELICGDYTSDIKTGSYEITVSDPVNSPSAWASGEVYSAIDAGLVPDTLRKNFAEPVTRGEVAGMFVELLEKASGRSIDSFMSSKGVKINYGAFTDTTDKNVLAANALGIINGVGGGLFDPDGTLTRSEIAAIMNRIAGVLGIKTTGYTHGFSDVAGHWVDSELGWPVHAGVITGVGGGLFDPDGVLTNEQSIAMVYRTEIYIKKN